MAKYLRIPSTAQATTTNGDFFIDIDSILSIVPVSDTVLHINADIPDTSNDTLVLTFNNSSPAPTRILHQIVCDAIMAANAYTKGGEPYVDLPLMPAIGGTATTITLTIA